MVALWRLLSGLSSFLVAPIALVAYVATLRITGGIDQDQVRGIREFVRRKISRRARAPSVTN
jgi:hypothetical protein